MKAILTAMSVAVLVLACGSQPATPPAASEVPPRAESLVPPGYPEDARKAGIEGEAIVEVTVGADGAVLGCSLATSAGNGSLDQAAVEAARNSKFAPGTRDGKPATMKVRIPFKFKLGDKQSEQRSRLHNADGVARRRESAMPARET